LSHKKSALDVVSRAKPPIARNVLAIPAEKVENQANVAVSEGVGSNVDPLFATA
jgi:hypothetical protein